MPKTEKKNRRRKGARCGRNEKKVFVLFCDIVTHNARELSIFVNLTTMPSIKGVFTKFAVEVSMLTNLQYAYCRAK